LTWKNTLYSFLFRLFKLTNKFEFYSSLFPIFCREILMNFFLVYLFSNEFGKLKFSRFFYQTTQVKRVQVYKENTAHIYNHKNH